MLSAAAQVLDCDKVRAGEIAAYCTREGFGSLLGLTRDEAGSVQSAARAVTAARAADSDVEEGGPLVQALDDLALSLEAAVDRNERRLEAVIRDRAGLQPLRFQADLLGTASDAVRALNKGLHTDISSDATVALYHTTLDVVECLFAPMSIRLDEVERLARLESPTGTDVARLEALSADPRVLQYFFPRASPGWLDVLGDHALLRPTTGGFWPGASYLGATDKHAPEDVAEWLHARLADDDCTVEEAVHYVGLGHRIGPAAIPPLGDAMRRFGADPAVRDEVVFFIEVRTAAELGDEAALELIRLTLEAGDQ